MPRKCTICQHPQRADIDAALVNGDMFRVLSRRFSCSEDALRRHKAEHVPAHLAQAQDAQDVAQADTLLAQVRTLQRRALDILDKAENAGDLKAATSAIREARECLALLAKLMGELDESPRVNVLVLSPEWLSVRSRLLAALEPFPDARLAVVGALDVDR
jgi:hypothetical protein